MFLKYHNIVLFKIQLYFTAYGLGLRLTVKS